MFNSMVPKSPKFSMSKHNILCSELKQLYVAVTRTRQRLWICDNTELAQPMFDYWKKKYLVQVRQLDDSLAQAMQVASSPEEWRSRGIKVCVISKEMKSNAYNKMEYSVNKLLLFNFYIHFLHQQPLLLYLSSCFRTLFRLMYTLVCFILFYFSQQLYYEHNYEMATMCFERASDAYWERMSKAAGLKATADRMRISNPEEANSILREAAEIFEAIGKADSAASCFSDLGEYERAGMAFYLNLMHLYTVHICLVKAMCILTL